MQMAQTVLFHNDLHRNVLFEDFDQGGLAIQSNQHLIVHGASAMILDPGGHKIYSRVLAETFQSLGRAKLTHIFLSHQDPDIVAALNGWLMTTDADAYVSRLWTRFVPHFGLDQLLAHRLHPIEDEGAIFDLDGARLYALPAHFLHSEGNFQLYDPTAKILYSGDLGASIGAPYMIAPDFDEHVRYMEGFHRRYMGSRTVMRAWAEMVRPLDIETIAPQHGALLQGKEMVARFIDWCAGLDCGIDLIPPLFKVPS
jgi:flavorubredoxin